jgi:hypothetical protein
MTDSNTLSIVTKKNGKEVTTYRIAVYKHGIAMTSVIKGATEKGQPFTMEIVCDKQ